MTKLPQVQCPTCAKGFEYDPQMAGQAVTCPHCENPLRLPVEVPFKPLGAGTVAHAITETKNGCRSLSVFGIGFLFFLSFPFSIFGGCIGILLIIIGCAISRQTVCSLCRNPIHSADVRLCPSCHALIK